MPMNAVGLTYSDASYPIAATVVLRLCHRLQVCRINAASVATEVIYVKTWRDNTNDELVRNTMRMQRTPVDTTGSDSAVSLWLSAGQPLPTVVRSTLVYFWPEPLLQSSTHALTLSDADCRDLALAVAARTLECHIVPDDDERIRQAPGVRGR